MYRIDGSQTNMDSFNVQTTLADHSSAAESPLGMLILRCFLKNLTETKLSWLELTPRAPFAGDGVSSPSAGKWDI